jgi:protein-L-isoaspartate(D-aspartate) O-methyltransferase
MERLEALRSFYASLIVANAGLPIREGGIIAALASTPREKFVGPGPWKVFTPVGYLQTPTDDPAVLYQDIVIALADDRQINNGQPLLHAACLFTLNPKPGDTAIHVGAGTGYYTAVIANLVGPTGSVIAYEVEQDLAERAAKNLADRPNVTVHHRSGATGHIPSCDVIYVNAGATAPMDVWLDALRPGGRLLFPLTPIEVAGKPGQGGMLLVTKVSEERFDSRFVCPATFVACVGARDDETARKLTDAFKRGNIRDVRSLHRNGEPDETSWVSGTGWWLSTSPSPQSTGAK